jgi:Rrf2 family protein
MRLGKASAYAVYATLHIARHGANGPVQARTIAEAQGIPVEYLLKILQQLVRAQVIESERGRNGGFRLRKTPSETTLLEIVEAIEGPLDFSAVMRDGFGGGEFSKDILGPIYANIGQYIETQLGRTTIQKLLTVH